MPRLLRSAVARRAPLAVAFAALTTTALAAGPIRPPAPPFPPAVEVASPGSPALTIESSRVNAITDVRAWFSRNRLVPDEWGTGGISDVPAPALPEGFAHSYRGAPIVRAIRDGERALLVYGAGGAGRYLLLADRRTGEPEAAFDLASLARAPKGPFQGVVWAAVRGARLYVETASNGYAADAGGRTAYLTALDLASGRVAWRSAALIGNARTFALVGDVIVAGYGFTRERDYLTVLDRRTGRPLARTALPSAPDWILLRRGKLFVRTYDHDLEVRVAAGGRR